jgi:hypothetical protein
LGRLGCRPSFIGDPDANIFCERLRFFDKERKRSKKKEKFGRGRPVETGAPEWKSIKVAFGIIFLMISTAA